MQSKNRLAAVISVFLAAITWAVFGRTLHHEFVNYDDSGFIYDNPVVRSGLTANGFHWAFTHSLGGNWVPLTTLSHMLDCQIYGLQAGGHHFTNVLIHMATVILLFLVWRAMTGTLWPSAFVAAVFAIHPLRAESVAWVAERKDVLSGLFFVLALGAYTGYARHPWSLYRYLAVLLLFVLGLMCKPMLVTLPFVLLLLDYWPLGRSAKCEVRSANPPSLKATAGRGGSTINHQPSTLCRLVLEKIPFFLLAAVVGLVTLRSQSEERYVESVQMFSAPWRLANALVSCSTYLGQLFYPVRLAPYYPPNDPANGWPAAEIILALALLTGISVFVFVRRKERPWLLVGWLWYLVMLAPVIGLVQVGTQARADRYTYLPHLGLIVLVTWECVEWSATWPRRREILGVGAAAVLAVLAWCARNQAGYWRDSVSLWTHTLACIPPSAFVEDSLGMEFLQAGQLGEAAFHLRKAVEIQPDSPAHNNNLGMALYRSGHALQAVHLFQKSLGLDPNYAPAHNNIGTVLFQSGRIDAAMVHLEAAVKTDPDLADAQNTLGNALWLKGRREEALAHYEKAIDLAPDAYPGAYNNLAWALATSPQASSRNGARAVAMAMRANQLCGGRNALVLRTLAGACAEAGRFPKAIEVAEQALQLASTQNNPALARALRNDLALYQAGHPLRDPGPVSTSSSGN